MNLKDTLNLPKTTYPMKLDKSTEARLQESAIIPSDGGTSLYLIHDGPPFANGDIHLGHAINKVIKDISNRIKFKNGYKIDFRPGWDCHGLPIENQIKEHLDTTDPILFRNECAKFAQKWVEIQKSQFKRLGVQGDWDNPYSTMSFDYEANVVRAFGDIIGHGLVYRKKKPVHWSIENRTALAVGELEYKEVTDKSVYVGFRQYTAKEEFKDTQFLVWTTTPWTLPANQALAVKENAIYVRALWHGKKYIIAENRANVILPGCHVLNKYTGLELTAHFYIPLFDERPYPKARFQTIYAADFVTTTEGTGIVHIAPAHGLDDYNLGNEKNLSLDSPVQMNGVYSSIAPAFLEGKNIFQVQNTLIEYLQSKGLLHSIVDFVHDYPHDWRSKKATIQLATPQWFISLDTPFSINNGINGNDEPKSLRQRAVDACEVIEFVPPNSKARFVSMLKSRPDWCISRQRSWGLPIPAFYNNHDEAMLTKESAYAVSWIFESSGSNSWFTNPISTFINDPFHRTLTKETDTFDVWFESAASWLAIPHRKQADVYIEGTDQHRGWFQHSLLLSFAVRGKVPFKKIVTHGFVVKPDGTKVSKTDPEYVRAVEIMDKVGVDPLRLWIASNDFTQDICASPEMIESFVPKYNKVRNTLKFLLSNLFDYDPQYHFTHPDNKSLDMWIMFKIHELEKNYQDACSSFEFHTSISHIFNFLNNDLSAIYSNAMKDRLYCAAKNSPERRKTQTTMWYILHRLLTILKPFIPMTVLEVMELIPSIKSSINNFGDYCIRGDFAAWTLLFSFREHAIEALDALKKSDGVNKATDAEIIYHLTANQNAELTPYGRDLEDIVGCGHYKIEIYENTDGKSHISIHDRRKDYSLCDRCWKRRPDVSLHNGFNLSERDAAIVASFA